MHLQNLGKHAPPAGRRQKGEKPFDHQHQGERKPKGVAFHSAQSAYFLPAAGADGPPPRMVLKKSDDAGSRTITSLFLLKLAL